MHAEYDALRRLGRFSLDDADAGRKLIENLDRRRVRLQVIEMCWHFGIPFPTDDQRACVKVFLDRLCQCGDLVQPVSGLYCRPDMTTGRASVEQAVEKLVVLYAGAKMVVRTVKTPAEEPKESLSAYKKRTKAERRATLRSVPAAQAEPSPAEPATAPPPTVPPVILPEPIVAPMTMRGRPGSLLQKQTEFILRWLREKGGRALKSELIEAAKAEGGLIEVISDLDVTLQRLINRTRLYNEAGFLKLTHFGEQEADYLILRFPAPEHTNP